ncbi:MAG: hypothetical protein JW923_08350 [Spirochaetales bacterium]|nr:hypothetical protein [Spirochaetales bacterium]
MSYILLAVPYAIQLLCLIHVIKTGRDSYWIWIIIIIPYAGGLAYMLIELLPSLVSSNRIRGLAGSLMDSFNPGRKLADARQQAAFTPSQGNKLQYADALAIHGEWGKALDLYTSCRTGIFKDDPELCYKVALALHRLGRHAEALTELDRLPMDARRVYDRQDWNSLRLLVLEQVLPHEDAAAEYRRVCGILGKTELEVQRLEFLASSGDKAGAAEVIRMLRDDEDALRRLGVTYDKASFRRVRELERELAR